ncbi:MAG: hypothetical protein QOI63_65, partial [Thermoplasmata archaeon]|nr:hypothetical protein [Thermoplasmata archaeon]
LVAQFPGIVPNPPRGQVLSLDLGGADTYANNAGGAILAFAPDPIGNPVQLDGVAVAVDLGGDDAYQLPAAGGHDAIQGAGMGGIGILYDQGGRDTFEADQRAQGYASSAPACGAEPCGGLFGVGLLVHGDGTATYDALNRAQGAAEGASHDAVCQDLSCLPQGGMETPVLPGGLGALLEGDGTTTYNLPGARAPHLGQAGADAGLAFLLDAGGNDHYNFGLQGQATRAGVGLLVDLGGQDAYTRQPAEQFADDHCWASLRAPQGDPLRTDGSAPPGFVDNVTAAAEQRTLGVFVDVTLPGIPPGVPSGQACYDPQQLQPPQPDPDPFKPDQPGDGWPEFVERLNPFGAGPWDAGNDTDYPAGLPHDALLCTQADALPPELAGLCAPGQGLPYGSSYLVRVPGVLAIGDAVQTVYPAATDATRGRDYAVAIDLGGGDRFFNRMGGGPGLARPDGALLASVALDVGDGNFYSSGEACVQGCNSLLLDLGANAFFQATRAGTPLDPTVAQGACLGKPGAAGLGLLFHAQGRATFRIEALGAGNLGQGAAATALGATSVAAASATKQATDAVQGGLGPCLGLLVDTGGDGAYRSPSQGAATGNGAGAGLFLDLGGRDVYVPAGRQGVGSGGSATLPEGGNVGIFVDQGLPADTRPDIYSGTVADLAFPDFSQTFNNRTVARATGIATPGTTGTGTTLRPPAAGLFWDQASASASGLGDPGAGAGLDLPGEGIRVGGKGADAYRRDYALLIDQGGDDRYDDNAGATLLRGPVAESDGTPPGQTAAVAARANPWDNFPVAAALIDLGGSDTFTAPDQPVVGAGAAGYGTLLSPAGGILSQGAGLLGVGLLVKDDGSTSPGTDHYRARGLAQGAAMLGSGILWKRTGSAVFSLEGDTVQAPAMDGGVVAWRQFVDGQWRLMAQAAAGRTCLVSPAGDSGPV